VTQKILVIDDDKMVRWPLCQKLQREGFVTYEGGDGSEGLHQLEEKDVDMVLLDLKLPGDDGIEVLRKIKAYDQDMTVVMMTGHGTVESAVEAMKLGAFDYLRKPFNPDELMQVIGKVDELKALKREVQSLRLRTAEKITDENLIGKSPSMQSVISQAKMVAAAETANVLLLGESGTGKNLITEVIHNLSPRKNEPFVTITCTAMPGHLIESELFGYEQGAFTDAKTSKKGLCEVADGGTLFLDEIGDMPLELQAKLLGFIESHSFRRIGGTRNINVDLRIIAATNKDLKKEIHDGRFREDLFYRLNVFQIALPPLRNRQDDIPLLTQFFIDKFNRKLNKGVTRAADNVVAAMKRYAWPGNIREFQNMIERSMILAEHGELTTADFPPDLFGDAASQEMNDFILPPEGIQFEDMERSLVRQALERTNWNQTRAARLLGFTRDQMRYRVKQFGFS